MYVVMHYRIAVWSQKHVFLPGVKTDVYCPAADGIAAWGTAAVLSTIFLPPNFPTGSVTRRPGGMLLISS